MRPARLEVAPDGSTVTLFSVGNATLHEWPEDLPWTYRFAELVERPLELGGGHLAVIGFGPQSELLPGALCVFDLDGDYEKPMWQGTIRDGPVPPVVDKEGDSLADFVPAKIWIHDIFRDLPGKEIVVAFEYTHSPCTIRIYDLRGELLYQRWHDGTLAYCYWMRDAEVLFFAGLNSEHDMDDRGYPGLPSSHARVLFGLKLELGSITSDFLSPEPGESRTAALWYRCLLPPPDAARLIWATCDPPRGGYHPGRTVETTLRIEEELAMRSGLGATVSWIIDERGRVVPESRVLGDNYQRYREQLPDPKSFYLGDLPPVVDGAKQESPP